MGKYLLLLKHWESFYNAPNGVGILNYEKWKMPNFSERYKNVWFFVVLVIQTLWANKRFGTDINYRF